MLLSVSVRSKADAQEFGLSFDGIASAYGIDNGISNPSIPLGLTLRGAGPTAQAQLSSLRADGFASFPYPGDEVVGLPGLASTAFFGGLPLPPYPLYTSSSLGNERGTAGFPGIALTSESDPRRVAAEAIAGTPGLGAMSKAQVQQNGDDTATARASTKLSAFEVGGQFSITGFSSSAEAHLLGDGTVEKTASLSIGRLRVPGLAVTIPATSPGSVAGPPGVGTVQLPTVPLPLGGTTLVEPDLGFIDGNFTVTLPLADSQKYALPAGPVLKALEGAGIHVTYQAAQETKEGILAPVMTFKTLLPSPPPNQVFNGGTTVVFALGRTFASISGGDVSQEVTGAVPGVASSVPDDPGGAPEVGNPVPEGAGSVSDFGEAVPATASALSDGSGGVQNVAGSPVDLSVPPLGSDASSFGSAAPPSLPDPRAVVRSGSASARAPLSSTSDVYLVVIAVGLLGTFGGHIFRFAGVRT